MKSTGTCGIFERVASGALTADEGARLLWERQRRTGLPLSILGHLWALPTSLLGFLLALVGGARPVRLEGPERAWVWHVDGGLLGWLFRAWTFPIGAQTIGGIILVRPDCDPLLLTHERCHVRQGFALGALYLPVYLLSWLAAGCSYSGIWMERQARAAAGER